MPVSGERALRVAWAAVFAEPILHVDMDAFFVEVERLRDRRLRDRPVVVGGAGARGVVAAASYEARGFGVRSAMPMATARRLCPDLVVVPPDHAEYGAVSEKLFALFRRFTPLVEGLSVDEAFLDVSGLRLHARSPVEIGHRLRAGIRSELNLPASVGVAASKFVAKLASEEAKPDGLCHVLVERQQRFLDGLAVERLWGVGNATLAALQRLGVATVADLRAVPRATLDRAVGGSLASHLLRLAVADDPRAVVPDSEVKSVSVEHTYDRDVSTREEVTAALRAHADRLGARLRRAGVAGRTVTLKLRYADFRTITRSETLPEATDVDLVIYQTALRLLERSGWDGQPLRLLGVGLSGLVGGDAPRQLSVGVEERWRQLDEAVDAVRSRFGADSVVPARLKPTGPGADKA